MRQFRFAPANACAFAMASMAALACPSMVAAQDHPAIASGQAAAIIVKPLRATALADLSFGAIAVGKEQGGNVIVSPAQTSAAYSGSVQPSGSCAAICAPHPAVFAVSGEAQRRYYIELPGTLYAVGSNTGRQLAISALTVRSHNNSATENAGLLDADGQDMFEIGGSLNVPNGTQADVFRADLPVIVSYN